MKSQLVVRPKVRTQAQVMLGARPQTETMAVTETHPKSEADNHCRNVP